MFSVFRDIETNIKVQISPVEIFYFFLIGRRVSSVCIKEGRLFLEHDDVEKEEKVEEEEEKEEEEEEKDII